MLAKCLNPSCDARFRYLNQGRIFSIEMPASGHNASRGQTRVPERFWLCEDCCLTMKVVVDNGTLTTVPLEPAEIVSSLENHEDVPVKLGATR